MGYVSTGMGYRFSAILVSLMALPRASRPKHLLALFFNLSLKSRH